MASKKLLKRKVKGIVYDILDSCDYFVVSGSPKADMAEKLMDEAVDFHDAMVSRIGAAKSKKDFSAIAAEVEAANKDFTEKLNELE